MFLSPNEYTSCRLFAWSYSTVLRNIFSQSLHQLFITTSQQSFMLRNQSYSALRNQSYSALRNQSYSALRNQSYSALRNSRYEINLNQRYETKKLVITCKLPRVDAHLTYHTHASTTWFLLSYPQSLLVSFHVGCRFFMAHLMYLIAHTI
jgi:hypothetical protein